MFCVLAAAVLTTAPVPAPQVYVQALIASVDADFARRIGWTVPEADVTYPGTWDGDVNALVRAAKAVDKIDIYSRPSLLLAAEQTGFFQVGQHVSAEPTATVLASGLSGITVRVVPTPAADGAAVGLKIEAECVDTQSRTAAGVVAFDTEQVRAAVSVPCGKTVCLQVGKPDGKKTVRLAFVTAHLMATTPLPPATRVEYSVPLKPVPNPFVTPKTPNPPMMPAATASPVPAPRMPATPPPGVWTAYPAPVAAKPAPDAATLPELVAAYRAACERQDAAAAMRLAVKALALDPTCFK